MRHLLLACLLPAPFLAQEAAEEESPLEGHSLHGEAFNDGGRQKAYMMGGTGGYLVGYVLATVALGALAARGWDRSMGRMAAALLIGNALIYVPGLLWLGQLYGWDKPILQWGLTPFLVGDAIKLALAAVLLPTLWKLVGKARG